LLAGDPLISVAEEDADCSSSAQSDVDFPYAPKGTPKMLCEYNALAIAHNPMSNIAPNPIIKAPITSRRITANPLVVQLDNPRAYVLPSDQVSIVVSVADCADTCIPLALDYVTSRLIAG
jgi:hypothetical protein